MSTTGTASAPRSGSTSTSRPIVSMGEVAKTLGSSAKTVRLPGNLGVLAVQLAPGSDETRPHAQRWGRVALLLALVASSAALGGGCDASLVDEESVATTDAGADAGADADAASEAGVDGDAGCPGG